MKPPATKLWARESNVVGDEEVAHMDRWCDPETGVRVLRLTSLPYVNSHIYPEAPVSMPDGNRFIFRRRDPFAGTTHFWIADLTTRQIRQITDETNIKSFPVVTPDGTSIYYTAGDTIMRMSPETFEREPVYEIPTDQFASIGGGGSISHCGTRLLARASLGPGRHGVAVIDLKNQSTHMAFEHPDCLNPHTQYCRTNDYKILVQVNDGIEFDADGNRL
ncbi:MAG: TolB family protein, partial [Phycisphaeraceae bacterium]